MLVKKAIYAASFDPLTNGHLWMIEQGSRLFNELLVVVGDNPKKIYTFTAVERFVMAKDVCKHFKNVEVFLLGDLYLVDFARRHIATFLLRGIRGEKDFQDEVDMLDENKKRAPEIETIFRTPPAELRRVSSSFVKNLVGSTGWENWVKDYLPEAVFSKFVARFK